MRSGLPNKIRRRIFRRVFVDVGRRIEDSIFVAGSGRSGTTWLADIVNYRNEYRVLFEPFHPEKVALCKDFRYNQYIRPEDRNEQFLRVAGRVLSGRVRDQWIDSHNRTFLARKRLVKDIRAHNMLKWLHANFPETRYVLLLRHPCAVASSRLVLGWRSHLEEFLAQDALVQDFLSPFTSEIGSASTTFEKHVFQWCIENYVPLRQFSRGELHLAFYELLYMNPRQEIERLFRFLARRFDERALAVVGVPSSETRAGSAILVGENPVVAWKRQVSQSQMSRALEILHLFGLDAVYTEDLVPNPAGAYAMMRAAVSHGDV